MGWHYSWTSSFWALGDYTSQNVLDNATEVYNQMLSSGWTHEAAIGAIANLCYESTGINAGQWQGGFGGYYKNNQGFGIGQWTPWTKVSAFVGGQTQAKMMDGPAQVRMLLSQSEQWGTGLISSSGYSSYYNLYAPYYATFAEYSQGTSSVEDMTTAYMICWERCGKSEGQTSISTRQKYATYFDEQLGHSGGKHYVTIQVEGNGSAYATPTSGEEGTTIQLHYTAYDDDTFSEWVVLSGDVTIDENDSFILGGTNVVIKAVFTGSTPTPSESYKVYMKIKGKGSAYAMPNIAQEGDSIHLYAVETGNNKFIKFTSKDVEIKDAMKEIASFTMPAKDVTIYAWFNTSMPIWMMLRPEWTMH